MVENSLLEKLDEVTIQLNQIIALLKITFSEKLIEIKRTLLANPVNGRILELADGTRGANSLKDQVATDTDVSTKTVERRIIELVSRGLLTQRRKGKEIIYITTNLF